MRKKGMKLLSKIVAACFALILTISMAMPVQAQIAKDEKHTITVTGKATDTGARVDVYKIIDVKFDYENQQPINPTYVWVDEVANWLIGQKDFESYIANKNEVPKSFAEVSGAELSNLMRKLRDALIKEEIKLDSVVTGVIKNENHQIVFNNMDMGQYLILTTADTKSEYRNYEYAPATANIVPVYDETKEEWFAYDAAVTIKGSPAEIEKDVRDHTVEIGQEVNYTVTVPVPYYPEDAIAELFRIGDLLPLGITFGKTYEENKLTVSAIYENGKSKQIGTSENRDTEIFKLHYDVLDLGNDGIASPLEEEKNGHKATFLLDFDYDVLMEKFGTIKDNENTFALKSIEVTYTGTINENAILRPDDPDYPADADPLENKAYVGQNNNPYDWDSYDTTEDKEKVYTYAINILKVAEDKQEQLKGAEFQLFRKDKTKVMEFVKMADGEYRLAKEDDTNTTTKLAVGENKGNIGKLKLEGLTTGTYYLQETKAPNGYEVFTELIEVQIIDEDEDGIVDEVGDFEGDATNIVYKTVINRKPPIMPVTGGMGTVIFSIVGIILVVGGVTLITAYLRRRRA